MSAPAQTRDWRPSTPLRRALFFFNDTATTEIYTLSLHDALPIYRGEDLELIALLRHGPRCRKDERDRKSTRLTPVTFLYLVCRLLLEKKKHEKPNNYGRVHTAALLLHVTRGLTL